MKLPQALPSIEGRRGAIVRVVYLALALPTAVLVALGLWFSTADLVHNVPATMRYGLRTFTDDAAVGGHHLQYPTAEAKRAGVRDGDRIVAIDGVPVRAGATEFEVGDRLAALTGPLATLDLRAADGARHRVRLARDENVWWRVDPFSGLPVWLYVVAQLATRESFPLVMLAASLLLSLRRPRDPEAMLFAFAQLMLCMRTGGLWWWEGSPIRPEMLQSWWLTGWIASFIAIAGFPDGRFVSRLARVTVALLLGVLVAGWGTQCAVMLFGPGPTLRLIGGLASILLVCAAIAAGVAVVLRYRATRVGAERQQIKWAVGGFCITLVLLVVLVVVEASGIAATSVVGNPVSFLGFGLLSLACTLALPLGLIVSLLRYRLYDAEATIGRSAVYAALTVSLLAIFAGSEKVIEAMGQQYFGGSLGALAGGIGAGLAAVMIAPLHHRLSEWSERQFQQGLARLRKGLPLLVADMRETAGTDDIATAVLRRVEQGVRARHAAMIVGEAPVALDGISANELAAWRGEWDMPAEEGLDCDRGDARFPLRVPLEADGCGRVGWLLLGPRPDGSFYGRDEREALAEVADPVARAIAIVRQREARQALLDARIAGLESAVARLTVSTGLRA